MRTAQRIVFVFFALMGVPALALAQASITGTVKDASGAVLPGATVEVASPALIEKVRTTVTDGNGQYRIIDLRPGTYSVTFSLPGFSAVKREGIELTGTFVARIDGDLRVGTLEETVTVTGETPIVDVQSVRRQSTIGGDTIADLPTSRSYGALFALIPAVTTTAGAAQDVQVMPGLNVFGGAGGRSTEGRLQVEGLTVGAALSGGGVSSYVPDVGNSQEVTFTTSGGLGEAEVGGPTMNIVPKTGGNSVRGNLYLAGANSAMVGSNYSQKLKDAGLSTPGDLLKLWDYALGVGGPILKDRIWYYGNARNEGSWRSVPGMYANKNAGDPTKFTYVPDLTRQAATAGSFLIAAVRITAQPTQRNKFNLFWDEQAPCQGAAATADADACRHSTDKWIIGGAPGVAGSAGVATATSSPEVSGYGGIGHAYQRVQQATWTSPLSNRVLAEAGLGTYISHYGGQEMPGNPTRDIPKLVEQCTAGCPNNGNIQNLTYGSQQWANNKQFVVNARASLSYVIGAQSMKFGYAGIRSALSQTYGSNNTHLQYRLNNGVPNLLTFDLKPYSPKQRTRNDAFYAQEQWTLKRLTLQGALRFDHAWSYFPEQRIEPTRFLPESKTIPAQPGVLGYYDVTPRGGLAYDLFGNANTALKFNVGKYLAGASNDTMYAATNPVLNIAGIGNLGAVTVTRPWTDSNGNYTPECDLVNPVAQDNRASGGDICGALSDNNFGKSVATGAYDPAVLEGWGVRPSDWQIGVSVQQKVVSGVSVEVGYFRRWLQGFTLQDNRAVTAANYDPFSITAPLDPRLPGGGGYVVSGLFNINPSKQGQVDNLTTNADNYGHQTSVYNGLLINATARLRHGLTFQGGVNTGKTVQDTCDIRAVLPETAATNPYCHDDPGLITRVSGLTAYTVPKVDVLVSATFRSDQGTPLAANYTVSSAVVAQTLGRPLAGGSPSVTINLLEPGAKFGARSNEIDLRIGKVLKFGRTRSNVGVDLYNLMNANPVLTYNQSFTPNGRWLAPTSVMSPRFAKISASIDF
jgi:hypothetical protein